MVTSLFNIIADSNHHCINTGPELHVGLYHCVPVEDPHPLLHLIHRGFELLWKVLLDQHSETPNTKKPRGEQLEELGGIMSQIILFNSIRGSPRMLFYETTCAKHFYHPHFVLLLQLFPSTTDPIVLLICLQTLRNKYFVKETI